MTYDLLLVGTGFASSFFLLDYLARAPSTARVLVLERGFRDPHAWQLRERRSSRLSHYRTFHGTGLAGKDWKFTVAFGGGSNCWWACTPRLMPADFRMKTLYGVGEDWPIGYADLEPFYERVEEVMSVSGSADRWPYPRRGPHPQPPHRMTEPDRLLAAAYPDSYFPQPTARARLATDRRPACCANGVCTLCPVDAKFTIENGIAEVYDDPRVTVRYGCEVTHVDVEGGRARGVLGRTADGDEAHRADLVVLGANALFNAAILMRSRLSHRLLGRRLFEQVSVMARVDLDGVDNFQGSTVVTGHGYMLYDGPHRATHAACLMEGWNTPDRLRWEPGRARQLAEFKFIFEDLPQERNGILIGDDDVPVIAFSDYGDYAYRGIEAARQRLDGLLSPLPVERIRFDRELSGTEAHLLGTVVMGDDPTTSIVDRHLVHHQVRNLVVLGGSAFPTGSPANPTLTISALSLWSARGILGSVGT
jgi:choline dehydrogenase-like flavoprotein